MANNSSTVAAGETATASQYNNLRTDVLVVPDDTLRNFGGDSDAGLLLRGSALSANTTLSGVIEGSAATLAVAANSMLIGNVTNDGDIAIYVSKGGNTHTAFLADGSTGDTIVNASSGQSVDVYIAGSKEIDYATGAMAFQQATTVKTTTGALTIDGDDGVVLKTTGSGGITVGTDGSGEDFVLYSGTSGDNLTWDASE